jgi:hypothetical protein
LSQQEIDDGWTVAKKKWCDLIFIICLSLSSNHRCFNALFYWLAVVGVCMWDTGFVFWAMARYSLCGSGVNTQAERESRPHDKS